jgi:hypothetical protein
MNASTAQGALFSHSQVFSKVVNTIIIDVAPPTGREAACGGIDRRRAYVVASGQSDPTQQTYPGIEAIHIGCP